jgi:hypothetical protein
MDLYLNESDLIIDILVINIKYFLAYLQSFFLYSI